MKSVLMGLCLVAPLLLLSCASSQECSQSKVEGNLGPTVNSTRDDFAPNITHNTLVFTSNRTLNEDQQEVVRHDANEAVFEADRRADASFAPADVSRQLPLNAYRAGSPAFSVTADSVPLIVFPRTIGSGKDAQVDLFSSEYRDGRWTEPAALDILNTKSWESQPTFSPDGTVLVFASDRKGGLGGIDLYVSTRTESGWSAPKNCGKDVNSAADDITPGLDRNGTLYFASNRLAAKSGRGFDLMRASDVDHASWSNVEVLPSPFNSEADDICPQVYGDSLFFASKRRGGCGGLDLYAIMLCGPVVLRGEILPSSTVTRRSGILSILDSTGRIQQIAVPEDGHFEAKISANRKYLLRYTNECADEAIEQDFTAPCNETKVVVLQSKLDLPDVQPVFSFDEYNVPFFSTGYYKPNTTAEMNDLRLKLAYNLVGADEGTSYIKTPKSDFDEFAPIVDSAMDHAVEFILKVLDFRRRGCNTNNTPFVISVEGYADAKPFAKTARYEGEDIDDSELELHVGHGDTMDNTLLAQLRAYYTVRILQQRLKIYPIYEQYKKRVSWRISAHGEDQSAAPDTLKRRVELSVGEMK